jgi:hypothetical protein
LIKTNYRDFIINTINWIYNRNIDDTKIDNLYNDIKTNNINIGWTFHAFYDKSTKQIKILDGQHRREAIKRVLEEDINMTYNNDIIIWLYEIENEEDNEEEIIDIFIKINNNKPIDQTQLPSKRKLDLNKKIRSDIILKSGISSAINATIAHPPRLCPKQIKKMVDEIISKYHYLTNDDILMKIKSMNNKIGIMAIEENVHQLFNKDKLNKKEKEIVAKAHEIKFYLNIKGSIYEDFKWIDYLSNFINL